MKTKKEKTPVQPKALTTEQNKKAVEHALKLKVEKEQKELEDIKMELDKQEAARKAKETQPKAEPKKEPKPETMAEYLDKLIAKGGTWEALVKDAQAEAEKKGSKTKISRGTIQGHLNYRVKKDSEWLKERNLTVAEAGIDVKK